MESYKAHLIIIFCCHPYDRLLCIVMSLDCYCFLLLLQALTKKHKKKLYFYVHCYCMRPFFDDDDDDILRVPPLLASFQAQHYFLVV